MTRMNILFRNNSVFEYTCMITRFTFKHIKISSRVFLKAARTSYILLLIFIKCVDPFIKELARKNEILLQQKPIKKKNIILNV
jgi:hypothetical protein